MDYTIKRIPRVQKKLMGQTLHSNARTTEAIHREIRNSEESAVKLAKKYNVNQKNDPEVEKREDPNDLPMGSKK